MLNILTQAIFQFPSAKNQKLQQVKILTFAGHLMKYKLILH